MDKTSITLGLQIGRILAGQRKARVPVAYLYNGIRLPKLPEWDRSVYPFAFICEKGGEHFFVARMVEEEDTSITITAGLISGGSVLLYAVIEGTWQKQTSAASGVYTAIWCEKDITTADDVVVLPASKPVPVYE